MQFMKLHVTSRIQLVMAMQAFNREGIGVLRAASHLKLNTMASGLLAYST